MSNRFLHSANRSVVNHLSDLSMNLIQFAPAPAVWTRRVLCLLLVWGLVACNSKSPDEKFSELMSSAKEYKKQEKYNEARIQLQSAIDIKPKDGEAYFQLAETLIHLKDYGRALESYTTAINYQPDHREARIHLASIQLAGSQFEQAESNIEKVLEKDPKDIEALIIKANLAVAGPRQNSQEARNILSEVLTREPTNVSALGTIGHIELLDGNSKEAEDYFLKAIQTEPNNTAIQMSLADLYSRQGRLDEAQQALETLITKNPEASGLRYVLGEFLLRRGLNDKALTQYEETLKKEPGRHDARDRLYDMYLARQEVAKAKGLTAELEKAEPNNSALGYFKGRDAEFDGDIEKALASYLDSLKLVNNFAPLFRRAGIIEIQMGKTREGIEHLNQAVGIDPADVPARLALARDLFVRQEYSQAVEHLDQILRRYPKQLGANVLRADVALVQGETDKARKVYQFLVDAFPNVAVGYFKLGLLEERAENYEEAAKLYLKTLSFDQNVLAPARRLVATRNRQGKKVADMLIEMKDLQAKSEKSKAEYDLMLGSLLLADPSQDNHVQTARDAFLRALTANQNLIGAYFALGAIDSLTGDLESAAGNYRKLLEQNQTHVPTRMLLALTYERQEKFDDAMQEYRKLLQSSPRFGPAANNLAYLLAEREGSDLDEALKLAELAKEEIPRESSVADTLGWVHYKRGSARAALPFLEEAVALQKDDNEGVNPEIMLHLAVVQNEIGEKDAAKKTIQDAMRLATEQHPKFPEMKKLADTL